VEHFNEISSKLGHLVYGDLFHVRAQSKGKRLFSAIFQLMPLAYLSLTPSGRKY